MEKGRNSTNGGINFLGLLAILFIGLKLGHIITWSWWFVLSPLLIAPFIFTLVLVGIIILGAFKILKGMIK